MQTCPKCDATFTDGMVACPDCGAAVNESGAAPDAADADYDPEERAERFERRYGIDVGDRTVDEFLEHLDRQDYSPTVWLWLLVAAQVVGVALFAYGLFLIDGGNLTFWQVFVVVSAALAVTILGDTREVRLFDPWAKIRWTYVLLAAIPLVGHIAGFLYLALRRLMRERAARRRRVLREAGFDVGLADR